MTEAAYDFAEDFRTLFVPAQKVAPEVIEENLMANVSVFPPLGQVTILQDGTVNLVVLLEVPRALEHEPWEVVLWYAERGQEWKESILVPGAQEDMPVSLQTPSGPLSRLWFTTSSSLIFQSSLDFTVKFRQAPRDNWRWIREEQGMQDGSLINQRFKALGSPIDLPDLIHGINPDLKWKSLPSQAPGTHLWSIEAAVPASKDDMSTIQEIPIGTPWGGFMRWFALVRIWTPWLGPRHGRSSFELDKDAVVCSFLSPEGKQMVVLGLSGLTETMALLCSNGGTGVSMRVRHDGMNPGLATLLVAVGSDFEPTIAAVMYQARALSATSKRRTGELDAELAALKDNVKAEWYENWYDGLGYCTWNALGQRLTHQKVVGAVDALADHGIHITNLIIDDNWQDIDYRGKGQFQHGWNNFEAEPTAFPHGLRAAVSEIRSKHKEINHVAVWHTLLGYWAGIAPEGELAKRYKTVQVVREDARRRNLPIGGVMTVVAKEDVHKFYDDFYSFLSESGVDAVKTDAQFMMDTWTSAEARRELTHTYLDAWTLSSLRHFSIKAISCMSQTPQNLFYSQLPRNRPAVLVRNSDDFFPEIPSSHPWHVWTNAYNSLLTQHLNILPDWDMFQTVHDYSGYHAAARCISGGPIYITDVPGQHNMDLIYQMTGKTPRGKTVIFRPSVLGRSIDQYVGYDDDSFLKIGAYHGRAVTGTPILGLFNISARPLTDIIPLSRFFGAVPSVKYIVRAHSSGKTSAPMAADSPTSMFAVSLDVRGYEILTAFPLAVFHSESRGQVFLANLGLLGKMSGCAAILHSDFELRENGRLLIDAQIKALGVLGLYISCLPGMDVPDDLMITIQGKPIPAEAVKVNQANGCILDIDVEAAWAAMGLESGWANEVTVKVYFAIG